MYESCLNNFPDVFLWLLAVEIHKLYMSIVDGCRDTNNERFCYAFCTASKISAKTKMNRFKPSGNTWSTQTITKAFLCGLRKISWFNVTDASHSCAPSHSVVAKTLGCLFHSCRRFVGMTANDARLTGECENRSIYAALKGIMQMSAWNMFAKKQNIHAWAPTYLHISAIALLSLLDISVSTFLASVEHLHLWHVEQTHAHTFLQTRREILLTARTEDRRERIPERKHKYYLSDDF